ncbi:MAG: hypothetical protein JW778_05800 [Candidatus Altiarchaeota archaeon]|nr:hypothetical protein [Candidatus Altiarchaeota archaeon]
MRNNGLKEHILDLLSEKNYGLTIEEISSAMNVNHPTASKYWMRFLGALVK